MPARESSFYERVTNDSEVKIVHQIVEALCNCGVQETSIGVITPHRSQLRLISNALKSRKGVEALTADRYQGRDKDCIIISMVRSNDKRSVGDLLRDWRRLNVTFTRAKSKFLIVGSRSTLESASALNEFVKLLDSRNWIYNLPSQCLSLYELASSSPPRVPLSTRSSNIPSEPAPKSSASPRKLQPRKHVAVKKENHPFLDDVLNELSSSSP